MWEPGKGDNLPPVPRETAAFRLGRWFGQLPPLGKVGVVIGGLAVISILGSVLTSGDSPSSSPPITAAASGSGSSTASCSALSQASINKALEGWTGSGSLTVIDARKALSDGSGLFTEAWFIKGSAPGIPSEVFVLANDPGGLLVGADFVTREFFDWGAAAASGSPMDVAARATVDAAPTCLT